MTIHPELAQRWFDTGRISTRAFYEMVRDDYPALTWSKTVHTLRETLGMDIREAKRTDTAIVEPDDITIKRQEKRQTLEDLEIAGRVKWNKERERIARLGRWARLLYISDQHRPYHVPEAIDLALQIAQDFKPDVISGMSDFFDFAPFRRTAEGNALFSELWPDGLEDAIKEHGSWMKDVQSAASKAVHPSILGNHDNWLWQFLQSKGGATADYTLRNFVTDLADQGLIWMGSELDEIELSPGLMMLHGKYATLNVHTSLMNTLRLYGYQASAVIGHGHREETVVHKGKNYNITAAMSGCTCSLKAHYSRHRTTWTHGIVIGFYDPNGFGVQLYNVSFQKIAGMLVAHYGDKEYRENLTSSGYGALALAA